ncbi:MAG: glucose-6-phosphate isomerase [Hydrogenophaga sp.]|uniref:glucose-6-phosphate isomerase n=1 Tax=Hydrogenophaga sp. TaxID=1904254 RepID=UPI001BC4B7F3|nr:glucose-6-phosphate isomerase [Hydrogenophaga sp.]MBS3910490.1 glucose-6-phosphate isomerase [Hydrogenophaga sp.]MDP2164766.1 glucose-6-phosphate isomerase [Hydrogenophaga sp.]MDP3477691.1 glucose-6-phosphate isomerase [Hydrogenophaga sp.]
MTSPTALTAWQQLTTLAALPQPHLRERLAQPGREAMQAGAEGTGIRIDFTRQALGGAEWSTLISLAKEAGVQAQRDAMFRGDIINTSEQRAVLHVALRGAPGATGSDAPWSAEIQQRVQAERDRVCTFAERVRSGDVKGSTGLPLTAVVTIGIGGSDMGPRMAADALAPLCSDGKTGVRVHFVSNPDAWTLHSTLRDLNPLTTLIIVASKTFTTQETMTNAASARRWLQDGGITGSAQSAHLVAITAAPQKSGAAGYPAEHTFTFWDWVGGRYSIWSALGLPLAVAIGSTAFREFLAGGQAMDAHFRRAPLAQNLPVILALSGVWNRNFLHCPTQLLSTYPSRLVRFAPFVQQMDMESNGKRVRKDGQPVEADTGPIVWGGLGIDGQHAYFQLLHQGTHRVPVEFIGVETEDTPLPLAAEHHRVVNLNLRAQAQALALGRNEADTRHALMAEGLSAEQTEVFVSQRSFQGDVPSSTVWLDALTPHRLGALIALYEHKVFTQAAIWGINAYDQWGVELGKTMAKHMEQR